MFRLFLPPWYQLGDTYACENCSDTLKPRIQWRFSTSLAFTVGTSAGPVTVSTMSTEKSDGFTTAEYFFGASGSSEAR